MCFLVYQYSVELRSHCVVTSLIELLATVSHCLLQVQTWRTLHLSAWRHRQLPWLPMIHTVIIIMIYWQWHTHRWQVVITSSAGQVTLITTVHDLQ